MDTLTAWTGPAPFQPIASALDPPVTLDLGFEARDARFIRDRDTRTTVVEVFDAGSGEVIARLPSEAILRDQACAGSARARASGAGRASRSA